jgi:hypothetical protein
MKIFFFGLLFSLIYQNSAIAGNWYYKNLFSSAHNRFLQKEMRVPGTRQGTPAIEDT